MNRNSNSIWKNFRIDFRTGLAQYKVAWLLSKFSMKANFINTKIGPFWITLNSLTYVLFFAILKNLFFGSAGISTDVARIYVAFTLFTMSTAGIREGSASFSRHRVYLESSAIPLTTILLKSYFDIIRTSFYSILVIPVVLLWSGINPNWNQAFWLLVWFLIWSLLIIGMSAWLGIVTVQLPDISPLLQSLLTGLMFMTPIWWNASDVKSGFGETIVSSNPFAWCIQSVSGVFYGSDADLLSLTKMSLFAGLNLMLAWLVLTVVGRKIIYWIG